MFGFYRAAAAVPQIKIADIQHNATAIKELYFQAQKQNCSLLLTPALALSGASCQDLFFHDTLTSAAWEALNALAAATGDTLLITGCPVRHQGKLFNLFAMMQSGRVKAFVPADNPHSFKRYFSEVQENSIKDIPVIRGIFSDGNITLSFSDSRADILLQLPVCPAIPGYNKKMQQKCALQSEMDHCAVICTTPGSGESTTDILYPGSSFIASDGNIAAANTPFASKSSLIIADIDIEAVQFRKRKSSDTPAACAPDILSALPQSPDLAFANLNKNPFSIPDDETAEEVLTIQSAALAHRMKCCGAKKMVVGISGGLDSTLALLVLRRSCALLERPGSDIVAITMPGFGTTGRTKNNALLLAELAGAEIREIPIGVACLQHFRDIGHDPDVRNSVYENTQARERTQILMDVANAVNGIVIGTGDLSECALGWCTYNGDQMSMYSVNASIPKSIIKELLEYEIKNFPGSAEILQDIISTPVSPELLPPCEDGTPGQKTEEILGSYELHDFFLYHFYGNGASKDKICAMAKKAFAQTVTPEETERCLKLFFRRFFTQQFKRSASADGIQAGIFSFSPRGALLMPSDCPSSLWE